MDTDETLQQQMENARQQLHDLFELYGFGHACVLEHLCYWMNLLISTTVCFRSKKLTKICIWCKQIISLSVRVYMEYKRRNLYKASNYD